MDSKKSTFQIVVLAILGVAAFGGLIMFALYRPGSGALSTVVVWGTLPATQINGVLQKTAITSTLKEANLAITYVQKSAATIDNDVLKAMAIGQGPDAIILSQDQLLGYQDRITPIPYTSLSVRNFQDTFIQEGQLFLGTKGVLAMPFMIDPLVMYWNRDLLTSANIANPPEFWPQVSDMVPSLTKSTVTGTVSRSTIALGSYDNVSHAKEIISLLLMQAGSPIVARDSSAKGYDVQLSSVPGMTQNPGDRAVSFYTQFANSTKTLYSWNGSLPLSRDYFTAGKLALYLGYASENDELRDLNPNLNYDVALVPQTDANQTKITYGTMYGLAILKSTRNAKATFSALTILSNPLFQKDWSSVTKLPPVTRALYTQAPADPAQAVFYRAALQSRAWLDPNRASTSQIFSNMIRAINSGASRPIEAVRNAENQITQYIQALNL